MNSKNIKLTITETTVKAGLTIIHLLKGGFTNSRGGNCNSSKFTELKKATGHQYPKSTGNFLKALCMTLLPTKQVSCPICSSRDMVKKLPNLITKTVKRIWECIRNCRPNFTYNIKRIIVDSRYFEL